MMAPPQTLETDFPLQLATLLLFLGCYHLLEQAGSLSCSKILDHGMRLLFPIAALQTQGAKSHDGLSSADGQSMPQKVHKKEVCGEDHVDHGGLWEGHKKDLEVQSVRKSLEKVLGSRGGKPFGDFH